ncbi:hypothetical protein CC86DRAFT_91338 [Ophiobolus disseminans]|uniref:Nucleolar protein Dnt1-like N-terminal domain-containing protein n=1 Tax=Ophiobolus disseminans TaxID=1469910 RepID=A0A6A7AIS1_9PLEO|nr:hypothetical protein CC86DRAFT_91338 [Ophiobolus disseminans]
MAAQDRAASTAESVREMAPPSKRMRLTIEVLPLAAENAHGPYRAHAMAAFKGRKFALPVRAEDTFELVWGQIEQRYKKNYLDAQQAANFTITKLQDAYDCDLDLDDTVSDIFEGESDTTTRVIKVVPSFINRDFSVPPTSNLRPREQKRTRESSAASANKRRRTDEVEQSLEDIDQTRDNPVLSTESEPTRRSSVLDGAGNGSRAASRATRSRTRGSLVFIDDVQTGHTEFGPVVKDESPELGLPPPHRTAHKSRSQTPPSPVQITPPPAAVKRRDIYDLPSSQDEVYESRSPVRIHKPTMRTPKTVQKEVDLLNSSRQKVTQSSDLTSAFLNNTKVQIKPTPTKSQDSDIQVRMDRLLRGHRVKTSCTPLKPLKDTEPEPEVAPTHIEKPKSPSPNVAVSPPSSPSASHHPARFLSHSPTAEVEEEQEEEAQAEATESVSSSDDDPSSSDDETEDEEQAAQEPEAVVDEEAQIPEAAEDEAVEMPATTRDVYEHVEEPSDDEDAPSSAPDEPTVIHLPSSPPRVNGAPASPPRIAESSQLTPSQLNPPPVRHTPIPLPRNLVRTPLSTQATTTRASVQRPSVRYTGFRTLREQLADAETTPFANGGKPYDPRMLDLTKLVTKASDKPINGIKLGVDADSDDESSSSSSSDSDSDSD